MKRVCAWCRRELGVTSGSPDGAGTGREVTHGICEDCQSNLAAQGGIPLYAYLNTIGVPVLLVSDDGTIVTANDAVQIILVKSLPEIQGRRGGNVFECANARLPEGCGRTVHCSGCAIRRTVMDTFITGDPHLRAPAYLNRWTLERSCGLDLRISTKKVDGMVLLVVEGLTEK